MSKHYTITIRFISAITLAVFLLVQTTSEKWRLSPEVKKLQMGAVPIFSENSHIRAEAAGETSIAKGIGEDLHPKKQGTV